MEWYHPRQILAWFYDHPFVASPTDAERLRNPDHDGQLTGKERVLSLAIQRLTSEMERQRDFYIEARTEATAAQDALDEALEALRPFAQCLLPNTIDLNDLKFARQVYDRLSNDDDRGGGNG